MVEDDICKYVKCWEIKKEEGIEEEEFMSRVPCYNVVESLMYAMVWIRPYIAHVVSVVSSYMANLGKAHWQVVKWFLRYLKG